MLICSAVQNWELPNNQKLIGMVVSMVSCASVGLLAGGGPSAEEEEAVGQDVEEGK